jgi:hypothetical protein
MLCYTEANEIRKTNKKKIKQIISKKSAAVYPPADSDFGRSLGSSYSTDVLGA